MTAPTASNQGIDGNFATGNQQGIFIWDNTIIATYKHLYPECNWEVVRGHTWTKRISVDDGEWSIDDGYRLLYSGSGTHMTMV